MNRPLKFTIWHGFAASFALHSALALPFVVHGLIPPDDDASTLVIELKGVTSDEQVEEKVAQQMPERTQRQVTPPPPQEPPRQPPPQPEDEIGAKAPEVQPPISSPEQPVSPQTRQIPNPDEQQKAQTLPDRDLEADRLREYVKRLTKKVQANLVYPDEGLGAGLQGNATVSFAVAGDGQIKPGTLTLAASSGQPKLDASALATARRCAPFEPPPREMTISFVIRYGRKK